MTRRTALHAHARQGGTVLLVALMFLIVITLLGLSSMKSTTLEERMAGNARDYNIALQAAEAALRDAEADLKGSGTTVGRIVTVSSFPTNLIGGGVSGCVSGGLCIPVNELTQLYNNSAMVNWGGNTTTIYGTYTGAAALAGVSQAPRYVLELMQFQDGKNKDTACKSVFSQDCYYIRITARGWGANSQTQVTLQEVFIIAMSS